LPQEDPIQLDQRINQWIADLKPRNDAEREQVINAANLSWEIERARRCETARLAERVSKAQHKAAQRTKQEVGQLARRLLYNVGSKPLPTPGRPWEDNPAEFLAGLEASAEGCRWLRDHWIGLRVLLDRDSAWTYSDMYRLVRLLGKYPVEAINDPKLNAILLAWDALLPGSAERFWKECKQCKPTHDPGFSDFGRWREIADRPADAAAASKFLYTLIDEQLSRLEELLAGHEEIAGDEAAALADRASFDGSAGGERLRRSQTARSRELRQTLELLMKMRKSEDNGQAACDGGNAKDGETPELETLALAPEVATSNEDHCQPEATATTTPGPRKPKRDKSRSMSALKMVKSERLDEQGFEKFFADPPAALVVLKGLRKLAERNELLGRAPMRVRGGNESSVTGENHMKNAKIEANDDETQVTEPQRDRAQNQGADGEKRSLRQESSGKEDG
jgi:hypothetical protein